MFDIGASLREARTRRGLSLDDVAAGLRIRERYVTALEEERWELLPGEAYAKGFLRMYNERIAAHQDQALVLESLAPSKARSRLLLRTIVGLVAVAALVAALNAFGSGTPSSARVQADLSNVANAAPPRKAAAPRTPVAQHVAPQKPQVALIRAVTSRSWLSVRLGGANGKEIFRGFLNQGHSLTYGLHKNVWLRIGRPQALAIRIGKNLVGGLPGNTPANLLVTSDGPRAG